MLKSRIVFKADGSMEIGLGHIYRCIAIAQMLENDFELAFLYGNHDNEVLKLLIGIFNIIEYAKVDDNNLKDILRRNDIIVLDGYSNTIEIQKKFKKFVKAIVSIDDLAHSEFISDVVINHGDIGVLPKYKVGNTTRICDGLDYLILRKPFLTKASAGDKIYSKNGSILISLGSTDPFGITPKVLKVLAKIESITEINILSGLSSSYEKLLKQKEDSTNSVNIRVHYSLSADEIISLLSKTVLAITTASTTALEVCCCGVPLLIGTVVDNQNSIQSILLKKGCAFSVGSWISASEEDIYKQILLTLDESRSIELHKSQVMSIDGNSKNRILNVFKSL